MNFKESLKNFFSPNRKKVILVFILEFVLTLSLLSFQDRLADWQIYLISPSTLYLESTVNPLTVTQYQLAFHGAVSNVIALIYLYFLSCVIFRITQIGRRK